MTELFHTQEGIFTLWQKAPFYYLAVQGEYDKENEDIFLAEEKTGTFHRAPLRELAFGRFQETYFFRPPISFTATHVQGKSFILTGEGVHLSLIQETIENYLSLKNLTGRLLDPVHKNIFEGIIHSSALPFWNRCSEGSDKYGIPAEEIFAGVRYSTFLTSNLYLSNTLAMQVSMQRYNLPFN